MQIDQTSNKFDSNVLKPTFKLYLLVCKLTVSSIHFKSAWQNIFRCSFIIALLLAPLAALQAAYNESPTRQVQSFDIRFYGPARVRF
jgi:hypothetical protein